MDNMDFRKWLTSYGYTYEEYQNMDENERKEIDKRFKSEYKVDNVQNLGEGIKNLGCAIMMIPLLGILLFILFSILFN